MLAKKLLVRPGSRVAVVGAPPTIDLVLPPEAKPADRGPADIVLVYTKNQAGVRTALATAGSLLLAMAAESRTTIIERQRACLSRSSSVAS